jgi:hypothetical protein
MKNVGTQQKKWRRINPYICVGCGKRRLSFKYERAHKEKRCRVCRRVVVDVRQVALFPVEAEE